MTIHPEQDFVLKTIESRDVHFVRFWFTDVLGHMKSFAVIPSELENAFAEGMGFDGSCIAGFSDTRESDMLAFPEASTFQILPWRPEKNAVARMFCNIRTPNGEPFEGDPRSVLLRHVRKAQEAGYIFNVGPELEYYYFKDASSTEVLDHGGYFDLTCLDSASDLRRDTVLTLENMGIPVEYSHHENGPSQHEIDLRYTDAMSMADAVMTYKLVVKEIAMKHGVYASFMPKPVETYPGSAMHVHMSLFSLEGDNAFFDASDPLGYSLSPVAKSFLAGLLKYAPEFCVITNPTVNSYKRLVANGEAPSCIAWARGNRSTLVRVPGYRPTCESACRLELRNPDPSANPYLAFAVILASGLRGIEEGLTPPEPAENDDFFALSRQQLRELGRDTLPENLGEAIERFAASDFMREVLGDHIFDFFVKTKRTEWHDYQRYVSGWEEEKYLGVL